MTLTQKETELLKDLKNNGQLSMDKYNRHANCALDPQLKNLLNGIAGIEQQHLQTIAQIESGSVPKPGCSQLPGGSFTAAYGMSETPDKKNDCYLCSDLLSSAKHSSQLYDTCIFEFRDANVRNVLGSMQKCAQDKGKLLYDYMSVNSMQG